MSNYRYVSQAAGGIEAELFEAFRKAKAFSISLNASAECYDQHFKGSFYEQVLLINFNTQLERQKSCKTLRIHSFVSFYSAKSCLVQKKKQMIKPYFQITFITCLIYLAQLIMKLRSLGEYQQEREDEIYNARLEQVKKRYKDAIRAVLTFTLFSFGLAIYRYYITKEYVQDGIFYRKTHEIPYQNYTLIQKKQAEGTLTVSNQELERFSWFILQLSPAYFPQQFRDDLADKFSSFLILFGELYPCKLCKKMYFEAFNQTGMFRGKTKRQAINFVCQLHNKINKKLGITLKNCQKIEQQLRQIS